MFVKKYRNESKNYLLKKNQPGGNRTGKRLKKIIHR